MNFSKIKIIRIFSNGSLFLANNSFIKFKKFKLAKKDLLVSNNTFKNYKEIKYLLNYTNKYLKNYCLK
jgi:hypothetical protein